MALSIGLSKKLIIYTLILMNLVLLGMEILYSVLIDEKLNIIEISSEMIHRSWFTGFGIWVYEMMKTSEKRKIIELEK